MRQLLRFGLLDFTHVGKSRFFALKELVGLDQFGSGRQFQREFFVAIGFKGYVAPAFEELVFINRKQKLAELDPAGFEMARGLQNLFAQSIGGCGK